MGVYIPQNVPNVQIMSQENECNLFVYNYICIYFFSFFLHTLLRLGA